MAISSGSLQGRFPPALEASIRLHRHIDSYTDSHPLVLAALARFPVSGGVLPGSSDVFFDHCLARHWDDYAEQPLSAFTGDFYRVLLAEPALPGRLAHIAPFMAADDWLGAYGDFDTLEQVFRGIARRLSRPEGMDGVMGSWRCCTSRCWRIFASSIRSCRLLRWRVGEPSYDRSLFAGKPAPTRHRHPYRSGFTRERPIGPPHDLGRLRLPSRHRFPPVGAIQGQLHRLLCGTPAPPAPCLGWGSAPAAG